MLDLRWWSNLSTVLFSALRSCALIGGSLRQANSTAVIYSPLEEYRWHSKKFGTPAKSAICDSVSSLLEKFFTYLALVVSEAGMDGHIDGIISCCCYCYSWCCCCGRWYLVRFYMVWVATRLGIHVPSLLATVIFWVATCCFMTQPVKCCPCLYNMHLFSASLTLFMKAWHSLKVSSIQNIFLTDVYMYSFVNF